MVGGHRPTTKAIHSGTAVSASAKLWIVSANSAALPLITTITIWKIAVANSPTNEIFNAQMPRSLLSNARSVREPAWLWV